MNVSTFAHLRVHSNYTLLGGTATVSHLVDQAVADGLRYLALTDRHALYGAVALYQACREARIQPILGMTVRLTPPVSATLADESPGEVVLLAKNRTGYQSLSALSSRIQGNKQREVLMHRGIPWAWLKEFTSGVICLDGGTTGWLARYLQSEDKQAASRYASLLGGAFEEDGFVGVERHRASDVRLIREVAQVGERFGLRAAAMQPVYCLEPSDVPTLRLLTAVSQNTPLDLVSPKSLPGGDDPAVDLHWLSPTEVGERFEQFPEAITAVSDIVKSCEPVLPDGRPIWPKLELPEGETHDDVLKNLAVAGLYEKFGDAPEKSIKDRLRKELTSIKRQGFAPLFLLVADITRFARETAVPVNTRGSVANSLVAYCTGITNVDPIEHNLLFERFLNPARANLPDIDLDFCSRRRDEVLKYVRRTYGEDRVALVATISTLQPKSAVRETAKAYGLPEPKIKELTALLPRRWHPDPSRREEQTLDDVLEQVEGEQERRILEDAFRIVGQPDHLSVHPGGLVITPGPLTDWVPLQMAPKGFLITQFDFRHVEAIGLPKIDLLGIRALTVLADTAELIRHNHDPDFSLDGIPMDDAETAVNIQNGATIGVFQCESTGAQRTQRQLRAKNVADLAVANAFFKPGPATGGMAKAFVRRYRGEEQVTFLHPSLEPILGATQGVLLFQEQVLRVATGIAGLTWQEADHLRRGMSKFRAREMAAMRLSFVTGCRKHHQFTPDQAETLWQQIMAFAGYGFNQGHATAYADISYRSAFLKTYWPAEFLCARLQDHGGFHHPAIYIAEARRLGFAVRPPHVNFSERKFSLLQEGELSIVNGQLSIVNESPIPNPQSPILFMGLGQVRDLRRKSVLAIVAEREKRPFSDLRDLLGRVTLQKKEVVHLVQCGALDGLGDSRAAMLDEAGGVARAGSAAQMAFDFGEKTAVSTESLAERLAWETHILGWPVSANPIERVSSETSDDVPIRYLPRLLNQKTTIAGVRLPGWTGGSGFFVGDSDSFVIARLNKRLTGDVKVKNWEPTRFSGIWRQDEWGGGWFAAEQIERF